MKKFIHILLFPCPIYPSQFPEKKASHTFLPEMSNVSVEAIANVNSTARVNYTITNLQNLNQLSVYWGVNGQSMEVMNGKKALVWLSM